MPRTAVRSGAGTPQVPRTAVRSGAEIGLLSLSDTAFPEINSAYTSVPNRESSCMGDGSVWFYRRKFITGALL